MKSFIVKLLCITAIVSGGPHLHAASVYLQSPRIDNQFSGPFLVDVMLDTEGEKVSGISGELSFPQDAFDVYTISTSESVVSPWVTYPEVSKEKYIDGRVHIPFEGIFAGGFSGVRSAYYKGEKPGKLFSIIVIPKRVGVALFLLDNVSVLGFNERATPVSTSLMSLKVSMPSITTASLPVLSKKEVSNSNLEVILSRSDLIYSNEWYLSVTEKESYSPISTIAIAESKEYLPGMVASYEWHIVTNPYVLTFQDRSRYIHVKVEYANGSYTFYTIPPVENSNTTRVPSIILIGISTLALLLLVIYGTHTKFFQIIKNKLIP